MPPILNAFVPYFCGNYWSQIKNFIPAHRRPTPMRVMCCRHGDKRSEEVEHEGQRGFRAELGITIVESVGGRGGTQEAVSSNLAVLPV